MSLSATTKLVSRKALASPIWLLTLLGSAAFGPLSAGFERLNPLELTSQPAMRSWLVPLIVMGGALATASLASTTTLNRKVATRDQVLVSALIITLGAYLPVTLALGSTMATGGQIPAGLPWALPLKCGCIAALALKVSRPTQSIIALCVAAWLVPQVLTGRLSSVLSLSLDTPQLAQLSSAAGFLCLALAVQFSQSKAP